MGFTPHYRAHLQGRWRTLAQESLRGVEDTVRRDGADLMNWPSPFDAAEDRLAVFALARLAISSARCRSATAKAQRRPALTALAMLVLELLEPAEEPKPPPPSLPFRADLDG